MDDLDHFVAENPMPDVSIVPDGSFPVSYGEKGICRFWATSGEKLTAVKQFVGGSAFNVVLDDVKILIEKNDERKAEISEKIAGRSDVTADFDGEDIFLRFKGLTKHAASPEGSMNAAWAAADFLRGIVSLPEGDRKIFTYAAYILDGYYGANLGIRHDDKVFGKLTCVNGMVDIADGNLRVSFDIRYGTENDSAKMTEQIKKALTENGWGCEIHELDDGFLLDGEGNKFLDAIVGICREASGDDTVKGMVMAGGTYSRKLRNAYSVSTSVPYIKKKLDVPAGHGSAHQCDEMLCVDSYLEGIKLIALMTIECDKLL